MISILKVSLWSQMAIAATAVRSIFYASVIHIVAHALNCFVTSLPGDKYRTFDIGTAFYLCFTEVPLYNGLWEAGSLLQPGS